MYIYAYMYIYGVRENDCTKGSVWGSYREAGEEMKVIE
jgi:hypothetical protein